MRLALERATFEGANAAAEPTRERRAAVNFMVRAVMIREGTEAYNQNYGTLLSIRRFSA